MRLFPLSSLCLSSVALAWLTACESKPTEGSKYPKPLVAQDSVPQPQTQPERASEADFLARSVLPTFSGVWVDARYWDALSRTKSQHAAHGKWNELDITELLIDATTQTGDSLRAATLLGNHEGSTVTLFLRPSLGAATLQARFLERPRANQMLRYKLSGADSTLAIVRSDLTHKLITQAVLRKTPGLRLRLDSAEPLDRGLERLTNTVLFAGNYTLTDSTGKARTVTLTPDGRLVGFADFQRYRAQSDFTGPYNNLDYLVLQKAQARQLTLAYRINRDTLRLYAVQKDSSTYEMRRATQRYQLVRKR